MTPPQEQDAGSAFQKPDAPSKTIVKHVASLAPIEQEAEWERLWSDIKKKRRVAWMTCVAGLLLSSVARWQTVNSTVLFILGLAAVGFGSFIFKTSWRGKTDLRRTLGTFCLLAGIAIALWTIPIVQMLNQQNLEVHSTRMKAASSYAEIAAAGRFFEENQSGVGAGFIIGGLVSGFGVLILTIRRPRVTERR